MHLILFIISVKTANSHVTKKGSGMKLCDTVIVFLNIRHLKKKNSFVDGNSIARLPRLMFPLPLPLPLPLPPLSPGAREKA